MTHHALQKKVEIIFPQNRSSVVSSFQYSNYLSGVHVRRQKPSRFRSRKIRLAKNERRGMSQKNLVRAKVRASELPCIPQRVLRVLKILRHEKFLDLVDKYFKPFEGPKKALQSENSQPAIEKPVVTYGDACVKPCMSDENSSTELVAGNFE